MNKNTGWWSDLTSGFLTGVGLSNPRKVGAHVGSVIQNLGKTQEAAFRSSPSQSAANQSTNPKPTGESGNIGLINKIGLFGAIGIVALIWAAFKIDGKKK